MNKLKEEIQTKTIQAMKAKNSATLSVLRNIKGKITELEKTGKDASDDAVQKIIEKYVKQREEGLQIARKANREDLAEQERFEIELLKEYLPTKLSQNETRTIIETIISEGANNIGMIMGKLKQYGNTIDMKIASGIARELL